VGRNSNADNTNGALPLVPGSAVGPDGAAVELPAPPARIAQLIEKGRVTFRFYNPSVVRRRFAGETRFTLSYTYDARNQWRLIRPQDRGYQRPAWLNPTGDTQSGSRPGADGDTSDAAEEDSPGGERSKATAGDPPARYHAAYLSMMPDLRSLKVQRSHEIVLPNYLIGKNFYNRRLVLHEFDHVQISCSDRVEATFRRLLKETRQQQVLPILESIPAVAQRGSYAERAKRNSHFREISNDWIRKEIAARFEDLVQLVDIRYKALDAETSHGRYDVPEDFRVDF
ncbi:MAG: hypothetical protein AAFP69_21965, partial [Planctomycetota bacterium]